LKQATPSGVAISQLCPHARGEVFGGEVEYLVCRFDPG